ncbi:hypothetical protein OH77DRAFT_231575 [Trametes cingulata]|nr:hypothetical protein OH77DRAFT_231575 [Trametes cingulata]
MDDLAESIFRHDSRQRSATPSSSQLSHLEIPLVGPGDLVSCPPFLSSSNTAGDFYNASPLASRTSSSVGSSSLFEGLNSDSRPLSGIGSRSAGFSTPETPMRELVVSRGEYLRALRQVEFLQRQIQELENSNLELKTTVRIMIQEAGLHGSSGPSNCENATFDALDPISSRFTTVSGLRVPLDDIPSPEYDKNKHGKFRFWSADQWTPYSSNGALSHEAKKHGVPIFLEDENGDVFTPYHYTELCKLVKRLFQTLAQHSLAPPTWGARTVHAYRYMQYEVYKSFPVLAQCQGHFRLHVLLTNMYPSFTRYHLAAVVKSEHCKDDWKHGEIPASGTKSLGPIKKASGKRPATGELASHASKWPKHALSKAVARRSQPDSGVLEPPTSTLDSPLPPSQVSFGSFSVSYSKSKTAPSDAQKSSQQIPASISTPSSSAQAVPDLSAPTASVSTLSPPSAPVSAPPDHSDPTSESLPHGSAVVPLAAATMSESDRSDSLSTAPATSLVPAISPAPPLRAPSTSPRPSDSLLPRQPGYTAAVASKVRPLCDPAAAADVDSEFKLSTTVHAVTSTTLTSPPALRSPTPQFDDSASAPCAVGDSGSRRSTLPSPVIQGNASQTSVVTTTQGEQVLLRGTFSVGNPL